MGVDNATLRNDPDYQWMVRSSFDLPRNVTLDLQLRTVGELPAPAAPAYTELDARLAWAVDDNLELSVAGRNLLHEHHVGYGAPPNRSEIERQVFGQFRWVF